MWTPLRLSARSLAIALGFAVSILGVPPTVLGQVITSQLGFAPNDPKIAVLAVASGTLADRSFQVLDATTSAVVYRSTAADILFYPDGWSGNNARGDTYALDFSAANLPPGRYVVVSNGARSFPFTIDANVYDVRLVRPLEFFRIQRSGVAVAWQSLDGTSGGHGPDHLDDARQAARKDRGGGDRALIEQEALPLPNGRLDVSGGWFDAGDYNKYMGNTPWAVYLLLLTFEEHGSYWSPVDENGNGTPDIVEYARPALEWMLKMQHSDGSVYERVFNGFDALFDGRPDLETDNRPGTADDRPLDTDRYADITAKSSYAMAAAYRILRDPRYLDMAVRTWDWAHANQTRVKPQRYGAGLYFGDVEVGLTLGAIELYRTIGDAKYLGYATQQVKRHLDAADWVFPSSWDYQDSYVLRRYYDIASSEDRARIIAQLRAYWDAGITSQMANAYRMNDTWLYGTFGQNENSVSGAGDALWLFSVTGDQRYYDYAVNQFAWVFGRNPFAESWLASARVSKSTRIPHWRLTANHPIEGVVVPGAADLDGNGVPDYTDTGEWYYSEPTINQQAMFVRTMTALYHASGGASAPPRDAPPTASIRAPADGATVSGAVTIEANAKDDTGVVSATYRLSDRPATSMTLVTGDGRDGIWTAVLNTTGLGDGQYSLVVNVVDTASQSTTSAPIIIDVRNGAPRMLHIQAIQVGLVSKGNSPRIQAQGEVYIVDQAGRAVSGAMVTGHWEGATGDTFSATTDATGRVVDYSDAVARASGMTFTLVVDRVSAAGWVHDTAADTATRASISVP